MSSNFIGVIIKESLANQDVLEKVKILETKVDKANKWTLYTVEISPERAAKVASELSQCLESAHSWYADFKNDDLHFIIFRNKIFRIGRKSQKEYTEAKNYGLAQGIPAHQVNFKAK